MATSKAARISPAWEHTCMKRSPCGPPSSALLKEIVRACRVLHPDVKIIAGSTHDAGNAALVKAGAVAVCGKMEFDRIQTVIKPRTWRTE